MQPGQNNTDTTVAEWPFWVKALCNNKQLLALRGCFPAADRCQNTELTAIPFTAVEKHQPSKPTYLRSLWTACNPSAANDSQKHASSGGCQRNYCTVIVLHLYKLKCSLLALSERIFSGGQGNNFVSLKCGFFSLSLFFCLSQLGHRWLLCLLGALRCLYMGKISFKSKKQLPWIFTMLEQECFVLILNWLQKIFGAIWREINWTLPSLRGRQGKKKKKTVPAKICEAQINLELDKVQLCSHTLQSCGSLIYLSVSS